MPPSTDTRYVSKVGRDAWLRVKLDTGGDISLPQYLKVRLLQTQAGRDSFEILEGPYKGKKASVSQTAPGQSYLIQGVQHLPAATVRFDSAKQALWYGGKGPYNAFSGAFAQYTKVPPGTYPLQIPDAPHSATRSGYYVYTNYHKTWFRLGLSLAGSRFLHVGEISEGCVTVRAFIYNSSATQPTGFSDLPTLPPGALGLPYPPNAAPLASWDDLYQYLIVRRASDQSVGSLTVI
jgi:hypothetical protein